MSLVARRQASLDQAKTVIHKNLLTLAKHDIVKQSEIATIEGRVSYGLSIEEAAKVADFIVECINEKKDLKVELFKLLDSVAKPDALFGSTPAT